jgi:hypothetical protein
MKHRDTSNTPAGDWLDEALLLEREISLFEAPEPGEQDPLFAERCRAAAEAAWSLATLRRERLRAGFAPLSLGAYLRDLAKASRIDLKPVLAAFGVGGPGDLAPSEPSALRPLARLCRQLGMPVREAFVHLGLSLAEGLGLAPVPLWPARARGHEPFRDPLAESEEALHRALTLGGDVAARGLRMLETEVLVDYED